MRYTRTLLLAEAVLAVALAGGGGGACEKQVREARRPEPATAPAPAPVNVATTVTTTQPADEATSGSAAAVVAAAAVPADTQPASIVMTIGGLADVQFPPTQLLLHPHDGDDRGAVTAELFSNLPKSALRGYEGNELYLEMKLNGAGPDQKVDNATWRFKSQSSEKADSPNGIFLNGQTTHLQPFDVLVRFERRGGQVFAVLIGQFRAYEAGAPDALAPFVPVRGEFAVEVVQKR